MIETITRLYDSYDTGLRAALALKEAGFTERDLSLVANRAVTPYDDDAMTPAADAAGTGAAIGGAIGAASGLLAGMGIFAIPGIGPVVAAGWLASTLAVGAAGAVAGGVTGGIAGALADTGTPAEVEIYSASIRRGATLVTVRVPGERIPEAMRILSSFEFADAAPGEAEYPDSGWPRTGASGQSGTPGEHEPILPSGLPRTPPE